MQLLHSCNSFLGGQLLHIAIFNSFLATIAIAIAIVLMAIANALMPIYEYYWVLPNTKVELENERQRCLVLEETHFLGGYIALILQYHGRGGLTCWCHFPPKVPYPLASYFYNIMYILLCLYDSSTNEVLALAQNLASAQLLLSKCKPTWKIHTCLDNFGD